MLSSLRSERALFGNGLVARVLPLDHVHRVVLTFCLKTGSRYEDPRLGGISHFVEHMLFRGTAAFPSAHSLANAFEDLGGTLVASTAADHGDLAIGVPVENLDETIARLRDVVERPLFGGIEIERGIIREEILEDLNEEGEWIEGATLLRRASFGDHGLGRPITGTLENIESFTEADVCAHHARTYVGSGSVVAVAGPVDAAHVLRQLENAFGHLPRGGALDDVPPAAHITNRYQMLRHRGSGQTALHVGFRSPGETDALEPALEMLLRIIDDGMGTRLYHRLCDSSGLCYDAMASYEAYAESGIVEFATETAHERAAVVLEEILRLTSELAASGPTQQEMERAHKRARWQYEAMLDSPGDLADFFALAELKKTATTPSARLEELMAQDRAAVHRAAERVFQDASRSIVAIGSPKSNVVTQLERLALG